MDKYNICEELNGHGLCLFCLRKTGSSSVTISSPIHSLQYLIRHLKIDKGEPIPEKNFIVNYPKLLTVPLCEECADLNDGFAKFFQQLEKIRMEMDSVLNLIYEKLSDVDRYNLDRLDSGVKANYQIDVLRNELIQKCHSRLRTTTPRVKVRALPLNKMNYDKLKLKSEPQPMTTFDCLDSNFQQPSDPETIGIGRVKFELQQLSNTDNDNNNDDFEVQPECNLAAEKMSLEIKTPNQQSAKVKYRTRKTRREETGAKMNRCYSDGFDSILFECHKDLDHSIPNDLPNCGECGKQFSSRSSFDRHRRTTHMKIRFPCPKCGKIFTRRDNLHTHLRVVHVKQDFQCQKGRKRVAPPTSEIKILDDAKLKSILDNTLSLVGSGDKLLNSHSDDSVSCDEQVTPSDFQESDVQEGHMFSSANVHTRSSPKLKSNSGLSNGALERIIMEEHRYALTSPESLGGHSCKISGETFRVKDRLIEHHQVVHQGITPKCLKCLKSFATKNGLWRHQKKKDCMVKPRQPEYSKKHTFCCRSCNNKFTSASDLKRHFNSVHLKLRKFGCHLCESKFLRKDHLYKHQLKKHSIIHEKTKSGG